MQVTNNASFPIIAVIWDITLGYGTEVEIQPGETSAPKGPFLGEMGGGDCYITLNGDIICHEGEDNENHFHISKGNQLVLAQGDRGITIRHYEEEIKFQKK